MTTLLSAPNVTAVRGFSDFGYSYVYVLFEDGTDIYWARSRVLEYMNQLLGRLPEGVTPQLGPDATAVGWIFQYALVDDSGQQDLASLRSFQDWYLRDRVQSVEGVAEVASVGGFVRQYQVNLDPTKVLAYKLSISEIIEKIRMNNNDVGGRVVEFSGVEYMIRGHGYIRSTADIERIAVSVNQNGTPILLRDVASVRLGPDMRRGLAELNGQGEVVGGIVVMRFGEDVPKVIERVKAKLTALEPSLPPGVKVVSMYDRSHLIHESIATANENLLEELLVVSVFGCGVSLAPPFGADPDHHAAVGYTDFFHPRILSERWTQHHVHRRHYCRYWRYGRCLQLSSWITHISGWRNGNKEVESVTVPRFSLTRPKKSARQFSPPYWSSPSRLCRSLL